MTTDAMVLLKEDHKRMRQMRRFFRRFEKAGDSALESQLDVASKIFDELTIHTYIENECTCLEVRKLLPDLEEDILESYEDYHVADVLCLERARMSAGDDHLTAKMTVLIEIVEHHTEDEQEWFFEVRKGLGRRQLQDLVTQMLEITKTAPRKPFEPEALKTAIDAIRA